ncbi:MAG: DUF4340 domain-containing protein [Planctomycetaceae bacterium]|jgi:hypothetical protein|nr:DUF4340 domain-containing protein [Planctomycetaceae bacterium]
MNEITKTSIFIAVAIMLFLFAWLIQPQDRYGMSDAKIGTELLENFINPMQIKGLEIVKYVPDTADVIDFRVTAVDEKWSLPSHQNYPADAEKQMGIVASGFINQKVLDVAYEDSGSSDVRETHTMYGVVDPSSKNIVSGSGVGTKVTFTGDNNKILASLILGKNVEGSNGQKSYVRVPEQNTVYVMAVNSDNLSTKFDDWIEKNLLKLNSFNLKTIRMNDYSTDMIETERGVVPDPRFHSMFELNYDAMSVGDKWTLKTLTRRDPKTGSATQVTLAPNEKLNDKKLEEMRMAFDDLKIIDVLKKPETIAAAQRESNSLITGLSDVDVLRSVGYLLQPRRDKNNELHYSLFARQGEVFVEMNDGIVYRLMFGNLTGTTIAGDTKTDNSQKSDEQKANGDTSANTASENAVADLFSANRYLMVLVEFDESLLEKPKLKKLVDAPAEEGDEKEIEKLKAQRAADELENQRLEDEHQQTIEAGKRRAKELGLRFADWFFVISDDVFKKIHITDADLITALDAEQKNADGNMNFDPGLQLSGDNAEDMNKLLLPQLAQAPKPEPTLQSESLQSGHSESSANQETEQSPEIPDVPEQRNTPDAQPRIPVIPSPPESQPSDNAQQESGGALQSKNSAPLN